MSRKKVNEVVYNYPSKYTEGLTIDEIGEILKEFPSVSLEDFKEKLGVVTAIVKDYEVVTYRDDVELAIRCCLENREVKGFEFD